MMYLVTGCAGFIGVNLALRLIANGHQVIGLDDLSRIGAQKHLDELQDAGLAEFLEVDVKDFKAILDLFERRQIDAVYHLAGQTAVTTSIASPMLDFHANAVGTFNLLEALRRHRPRCFFVYASTNKVYGGMPDVPVREQQTRYGYSDLQHGVDEAQPLDFHSPYACSKGAADQYVRDYHRIYGISTVVCRQSCIYGPRQYGLESQGWVAWLILSAISGKPLNVYGDGKQVRDLLYIDDLIDCYLALHEAQAQVAGEVFNVGGGPDNLLSILELIGQLESLTGRSLDVHFASWRPADQRVYVSDTRKVCERLGWSPKISPLNGVAKLYAWICDRLEDLEATYAES